MILTLGPESITKIQDFESICSNPLHPGCLFKTKWPKWHFFICRFLLFYFCNNFLLSSSNGDHLENIFFICLFPMGRQSTAALQTCWHLCSHLSQHYAPVILVFRFSPNVCVWGEQGFSLRPRKSMKEWSEIHGY